MDAPPTNFQESNWASELVLWRKRMGLSQPEVAKMLQIKPLTFFRWEKGRTLPSRKAQERIRALANGKRAPQTTPERLAQIEARLAKIEEAAFSPARPRFLVPADEPGKITIGAAYFEAVKRDGFEAVHERFLREVQALFGEDLKHCAFWHSAACGRLWDHDLHPQTKLKNGVFRKIFGCKPHKA